MRSATARSTGAPGIDHLALRAKGFGDSQIQAIEAGLGSAFDIKFAFNKWTLGEAFCTETLGLTQEQLDDPSFDLLAALGFSKAADRGGEHLSAAAP